MLAAGGLAPRCWKCCQQQPQVLRRAAMACAASARGLSATSSLGRNARTGASLLASNSRHSPSRLPGSSLPSLSLLGPSSDRDAPGLRSAQLSLGQRSAESRGASFDGLSFFSTWQRQKSSVARTTAKATRGRKKGLSGYPSLSGADGDEDDAAQRHRRKWDAIDDVISKVNDDFGKGTVVPLDAKGPISDVEFFSTGECLWVQYLCTTELTAGGGVQVSASGSGLVHHCTQYRRGSTNPSDSDGPRMFFLCSCSLQVRHRRNNA